MTMTIWIVFIFSNLVIGRNIRTFNLNKNFKLNTLVPKESPDIECLVAEGDIPLPPQLSICFRSRPQSHVYHERLGWNWRTILSLGTMDQSGTKLEQGFLFGHWYSGPWFSFKTKESDSLAWTFTYKASDWPFQVNILQVNTKLYCSIHFTCQI